MIYRLLHFFILLPFSYLPFFVLYFIADILYLFLYYVISYRKDVISKNISNSFGHLDPIERKKISKEFYKHLSDIMVESIKSFTITKNQLRKRFVIINPEIVDHYAQKNQML